MEIPTRRLIWDKRVRQLREAESTKTSAEFLKGPVPLAWLARMVALNSVPVCGVGLVLWFLSGVRKSRTVSISNVRLGAWQLNRYQKSRALRALADAGLISIDDQKSGRSPTVTILDAADRTTT